MDYETLSEVGSFSINESADGSIYEMICKQELIKKELLEHKANFDSVWASNQKVQALAGLIYSDEETVNEALSAAIGEVPYLALASKKQLTETFKNSLNLNGMKDVSINDIQEFASFIFEQKKPARVELIKHLNERYGVSVQNLKEPASFRSLLNTQVVIFETLSKISPKGSVQREVLSNLAEMLKSKNGVEAIDVNDVIQEVFQAAGYEGLAINESLERFLEVEKLKELGKIIQMATGGSSAGMGTAMASPAPQMPTPTPPAPQGMDDDDVSVPPEAMTQGDEEEEAAPEMEEEGMEEEMPEDVPPPSMSDEDLLAKMGELEKLLSNLRSEISGEEGLNADLGDEEEEGMEEEMPEEEGEEEAEEIDAEQEELDSEEDEIEAEHEQAHEMENEAEAKEEKVRAKQKATEKKEDSMKKGG